MQETIDLLKQHGLLRVIDEPVDIDLEIPHVAYVEVKKPDSKALLFTKPVSKRLGKTFDVPVLMNVFGSYEATRLFFGKEPDAVAKEIDDLLHVKPPQGFFNTMGMLGQLFNLKNVFPKRLSSKGACQEVVEEKPNLYDIPVLTTWTEDGGPFITMGQVYTVSLDGTKHNLGMYRLQVYDETHLGMHWQIHKDSAHFFHEYKQAGHPMPVSIAIGGDPLYIWCGQAPMPNGVFELMLYGLIKGKNARLVKSLTNPIHVPEDVDYVIEGWVDPTQMRIEGPFGDHTGYYTLKEPYPVMKVSCITHKKNPVYLATVVGKPPLEDKYMGWATGRVFLPLLKTTAPELIDYEMPENGVFHNLILAKMETRYPGHAKQFMHAFWGVGQMSFVKHALFLGADAPALSAYDAVSEYILDRVKVGNIIISEGVCDALDHASPNACYGGKLGLDCTQDNVPFLDKKILQDAELYAKMSALVPQVKTLKQYKTHTKTPVCVIGVEKTSPMREVYEALKALKEHVNLLVFVDHASNDVTNPYMLIWRVVNNMDALRDVYLKEGYIGLDGTNKTALDGYEREWPKDTDCDPAVIESLQQRNLISVTKEFLKHYHV
ncbi:MAG: menaquinone biosynthesis decarboxylase [Campylobacterales bacterium]|nr:menaquinone biosynthesis decarboxylase [Campylobacterales bacterium]